MNIENRAAAAAPQPDFIRGARAIARVLGVNEKACIIFYAPER